MTEVVVVVVDIAVTVVVAAFSCVVVTAGMVDDDDVAAVVAGVGGHSRTAVEGRIGNASTMSLLVTLVKEEQENKKILITHRNDLNTPHMCTYICTYTVLTVALK